MILLQLFIWPLIIGLIIFKINPFNKEKNKSKRVIYLFIPLLLLLISIVFSIIFGWERGREQIAVERQDDWKKEIYFLNKTNRSINIVIDFKYAKDELAKKSKINLFFNKRDTIINLKNKDTYTFETPIMQSDTITGFPKSFNIEITDSLGKVIKTYNKDEFFNHIEKSNYSNKNDIESKEEGWTLIIK